MDVSVPALAYQLSFTLAALGCVLALRRASNVTDDETRYGLNGLLVASALWAGSQAVLFTVPDSQLAIGTYLVGLVAGFGTVFWWLYFASAYTGRTYHRNPTLRRSALALYLSVVGVKITNPVHQLYFRTTFVDEPFPHLSIQHGVLHWTTTGVSYALAAIGLFMLFELFASADYDTRGLVGLVAITGVPVAIDVIGYSSPVLVDVIYAPLGVATFAIGTLYVYEDRFLAVQLTNDVDDPVVFLDDDDRIRDYNAAATALFPGLADAIGEDADAVPAFAAALADVDHVHEHDVQGETRFLLVNRETFQLGRVAIGQLVLLTDVTDIEREREEIRRQDAQLEDFAVGIRHELRNSLTVIRGHLEHAADSIESGDVATANESLVTASNSAERMTGTVDDLATLAQYGQSVGETESVSFDAVARDAWQRADTGDCTRRVTGDGTVVADGSRLEALLANAFEFAVANDATHVDVALHDDGFTIEDDGTPIPDADLDRVFDHGDAVPTAEAGMALPNVRSLGHVQGWSVDVDPDYDDGVRVLVTDVQVERGVTVE
jgi:signal transduction histidine kinase